MSSSRITRRAALSTFLLLLGFVTLGSGTCAMVEEGPPGDRDDPGVNEDEMEDQEDEVIDESDR